MSPGIRNIIPGVRAPLLAALLLVAALVFAACGSDDDKSASSDTAPASLAPADAAVYAEALVRPEGDVADGVVAAARRVTLLDDPVAELRRALDEDEETPGEFSSEIEPWLGDRVGVFVVPAANDPEFENPDFGVLVSVRDEDAAKRSLDRQLSEGETVRGGSFEGVDYNLDRDGETPIALIDGTFFAGTMPAFRAAVTASRGDSLAESTRYEDAIGAVDDDALALAYIDPEQFLPALMASSPELDDPAVARAFEQIRDAGPVTMSFTATADELALEFSGEETVLAATEEDGGEVSIDDLPGDAWAAIATPPLGAAIRQTLEQAGQYDMAASQLRTAAGLDLDRDVLGWLGGFAAFVRGTAPLELGGGIVIGSDDEAASRGFVTRIERMIGIFGLSPRPVDGGFEVRIPDSPQPIVVLAQGDKVAIGFGGPSARDMLDPDESFADSENGKAVLETLGEGYEPSFALVLGPMLELVRAVGADSDPEFQQALPYLSAYRSIAAGTKRDDGKATIRIVAGLQDPTR